MGRCGKDMVEAMSKAEESIEEKVRRIIKDMNPGITDPSTRGFDFKYIVDVVRRAITEEREARTEVLITIKPEAMYKLGYPLEEIVYGHTIIDVVEVIWDETGQKWST